MNYFNIILFALSVMLIVMLVIKFSRHSKQQADVKRKFLDDEAAANAVRKKEIDPALFYTADLSALPEIPEGDPFQIERCAKRMMIYFKEPITNLELKMQYGAAQMDFIAQYEENFNEYLKALTKWAASIAEENKSDALVILELVISLGGEFRDAYKLAADIYASKRDSIGMEGLRSFAEKNHFHDPSIRTQILEYINMKKE
jgi:hypothetical protein